MDESASNANRVWRKRLPAALVAAACVSGVIVAVTGAASPLPGLQFLPVGHWVFNAAAQRAFHIDGGTDSVDSAAQVPGDPGSQVVQSDTSGYVVGRDKIVQFGKSDLSVEQTSNAPAGEPPVSIEANGGPYLVYESSGQIVRLGDPSATISAGGAIADPVVTSNGTLWVMHQGTGQLCEVPKGGNQINNCPATAPAGHTGTLTVVADRPTLVDTTANTLHAVSDKGLGPAVPLGVRVSAGTTAAPSDVDGKVALLDQPNHTMDLVDAANPGVKPVSVPLPSGDYTGPVSTGSAVALVNQTSNTLLTFDANGKQQDSTTVPAPVNNNTKASDQLSKGEDSNVYLDNPDGSHVLVVAHNGKVTDVPVVAKNPGSGPNPGPAKPKPKPNPNPPPNTGGPVQQADQPKKQQPNPNPPPVQSEKPPQQQKPAPPPNKPSPPEKPAPPTVPASPPGAPGSVKATAGNAKITVSWAAADANRSAILSYTVTVGGKSVKVGGSTHSAAIAGLTNGHQYVATVSATNAKGTGAAASSNSVTPVAPVGPAGAVTGLAFKATTKTLSWGQPDLNGGTLKYYQVTATGQATQNVTATSVSFSNITTKTTFTVRAVTSAGNGTLAQTVYTPTTQGTPQIVISRGGPSNGSNCDSDCYQVDATMTGFPPNTTVTIELVRSDGHVIDHSDVPINDEGGAHSTGLSCDSGNQGRTIFVQAEDGTKSGTMIWE